MILEFSSFGALDSVLQSRRLCTKMKLKILMDVAIGMKYLHDSNIVLRDLKPANILVMELFLDSDSCIRLSDISSGKNLSEKNVKTPILKATTAYVAPETYPGLEFSTKSDVFSFSMTTWHVFAERQPFEGIDDAEIKLFVGSGSRLSPERMEKIPKIENLMRMCWDKSPLKRPSFPFISEVLIEGFHSVLRSYDCDCCRRARSASSQVSCPSTRSDSNTDSSFTPIATSRYSSTQSGFALEQNKTSNEVVCSPPPCFSSEQ